MNSKRKWQKFERLVAAIHAAKSKGAAVKWNDIIQGRQFDVSIRFKFGLHDYLTVIECKDYKDKVSVDEVDAFVTKSHDVHASKAIMVAANGYQSGCRDVAERHGIRLLTLNEQIKWDISHLVAEMTPALNIYDVRLLRMDGHEIEFEDGGKLAYLMKQIRLESPSSRMSPNQVIREWQKNYPIYTFNVGEENAIVIPLPENTIAHVPFQEAISVTELRFIAKLIEAFIPNQPILDRHLMEELAVGYELIDERGQKEEICALDIDYGFDTTIEIGKFCMSPKLNCFYYCDRIEGEKIRWILVESYQHGELVRATLTQDARYSGQFIEVTDQKKIRHLKKLLQDYLNLPRK